MANGVPQPTQQRPQKPTQVDHILQAHTLEGNMDNLYKELKAGGVDVDQFNAEMQAAAKAQESRSWILGSGSLKAMGNGAFMAGYSMWDLFAGRSRFSMRNLGVKPYPLGEDYNTKLGGLVEGATQFMIPFLLSRKGLQSSRIQQLAKNEKLVKAGKATKLLPSAKEGGRIYQARKVLGAFFDGAVLSLPVDFLVFDPHQQNLFQSLKEWGKQDGVMKHVKLPDGTTFQQVVEQHEKDSLTGNWEKAATLQEQFEYRIQTMMEGLFGGAIIQGTIHSTRMAYKWNQLRVGKNKLQRLKGELEQLDVIPGRDTAKARDKAVRSIEVEVLKFNKLLEEADNLGNNSAKHALALEKSIDNWGDLVRKGSLAVDAQVDPWPAWHTTPDRPHATDPTLRDLSTTRDHVDENLKSTGKRQLVVSQRITNNQVSRAEYMQHLKGNKHTRTGDDIDPFFGASEADIAAHLKKQIQDAEKAGDKKELTRLTKKLKKAEKTGIWAADPYKDPKKLPDEITKRRDQKKKVWKKLTPAERAAIEKHLDSPEKVSKFEMELAASRIELGHPTLKPNQLATKAGVDAELAATRRALESVLHMHGIPTGGKVFNYPHFKEGSTAAEKGRMVVYDGENIIMDFDSIAKDWDENFLYFQGGREINGQISLKSRQESKILEAMNLDPIKLQGALHQRGGAKGGAKAYAKFLELRQRKIIEYAKKSKTPLEELNPQNFEHLQLLTKSTYDALMEPAAKGGLGIDPHLLSGKSKLGGVLRLAEAVDYSQFERAMMKVDAEGNQVGLEKFNEFFQRAMDGDESMLSLPEQDFWRAAKGGSVVSSNAAMIAMSHMYKNLFTQKFGVTPDIESIARAFGYNKKVKKGAVDYSASTKPDSRTPHQFLVDSFMELTDSVAGGGGTAAQSLGIDGGTLRQLIGEGEGAFQGAVRKIDVTKINELSAGDLADLHIRVLSMRIGVQQRGTEIGELAAEIVDKIAKDTFKSPLAKKVALNKLVMLKQLQALELDSLATARHSWGLTGRMYQDMDKLMAKLGEEGHEEVLDKILRDVGGEDNVEEMASLIVDARKGTVSEADQVAKEIAVAKMVNEAAWTDAVDMFNEIWINAMLSGLQTQSINNVSNAIKLGVTLGEQYLGGFVPNVPWAKKIQRTVLDTDVKEAVGRAFARGKAAKQAIYAAGMSVSILRMWMRAGDTSGGGAFIKGTADSSGRKRLAYEQQKTAWDSLEDASSSEMEHFDPTKTRFSELPASPASSKGINAWAQRVAEDVSGPGLRNVVAKIGDSPFAGGVADLWNGLYHGILRKPMRMMGHSDMLWRTITLNAHVDATLASYAVNVRKIRNPDDIADFVVKYRQGMVKNGEVFSEARLKKEAQELVDKDPSIPVAQRSAKVREYIAKNWNIHEGQNVGMDGSIRAELGTKALRDSEDVTFTSNLDQVHEDYEGDWATKAVDDTVGKVLRIKPSRVRSLGGWLQKKSAGNPWVRLLFPFIRTPLNIFRDFGKRTSILGMASRQNRMDYFSKNPADNAAVKGRIFGSTAALTIAYNMADQGRLTGGGPMDPIKRETWKNAGWKPYCFVFEDGSKIQFSRVEPFGYPFKWMADYRETMDFARDDEEYDEWAKDWGSSITIATMSLMRNATYAQGITELGELIASSEKEGLEGKLGRFISQRLSAIGGPSIVKNIMTSFDDLDRQVKYEEDQARARRYPFGIEPKRDPVFGYIQKTHERYPHDFIKAITPFKFYEPNLQSPVYKELTELTATMNYMNTDFYDNPNIKMWKFNAIISHKDPKKKNELKAMARAMKTRAVKDVDKFGYMTKAVPCPVFQGQSAYDYTQQYISVRKRYYTKADIAIWADKINPEWQGKGADELRTWVEETKQGLSGAMGLEAFLLMAMSRPSYTRLTKLPDTSNREKSFRVTILRNMVQQFRNEAIDELRGRPYNPYAPRENRGFAPIVPAPKGKVRTSYGGAYGVFWKNMIVQHVLAQEASIEHEGKDPRDRQLNRLQRIKGLRDSPLDQ